MVGHQVGAAGDVGEEDPSVGAPGEAPDQHQGHGGHNQLPLSLQKRKSILAQASQQWDNSVQGLFSSVLPEVFACWYQQQPVLV